MASNRAHMNYNTSSSSSFSSASQRGGISSAGLQSSNFASSRGTSFSTFSQCGTAKFSSLLSSSSAFSPSSYHLSPLSSSYKYSKEGNSKSTTSSLSPVVKSNIPTPSSHHGGFGNKFTTKSNFGTSSRDKNLQSPDGLVIKTDSPTNYHLQPTTVPSLRASHYTETLRGQTGGNDAKKSIGGTTANGPYGSPSTSTYHSHDQQSQHPVKVTTELKSTPTDGAGITFGTIGRSAIASLRTSSNRMKTNLRLHTTSYGVSSSSYSGTSKIKTTENTDDLISKENKRILKMSRGTSPYCEDDSVVSSSVKITSKISMDEEVETKHPAVVASTGGTQKSHVSREVQTDRNLVQVTELMKSGSKPYVSSIPRPSTTFYSPFSSALSRFTVEDSPKLINKSSLMNQSKMTDEQFVSYRIDTDITKGSKGSSIEDSIEVNSSSITRSCHAPNYLQNRSSPTPPSTDSSDLQIGNKGRRPPTDPNNKISTSKSGNIKVIEMSPLSLSSRSPSPTRIFVGLNSNNHSHSKPVSKINNGRHAISKSSSNSKDTFHIDHPARSEIELPKSYNRTSPTTGKTSTSGTSSRSSSTDRSTSSSSSLSRPSSCNRRAKSANDENQIHQEVNQGSSPPLLTSAIPISKGIPDKLSWIKKSESSSWWNSKESQSNESSNKNTILKKQPLLAQEKIDRPQNFPIGDRTSPDGTEIPSPQVSSSSSSPVTLRVDKKDQLFINSQLTNIDDILGKTQLSPGFHKTLADDPPSSPEDNVNTPFVRKIHDSLSVATSGRLVDNLDASSEKSDMEDNDDDDDDGASTGSCSSFEEVDPMKLLNTKTDVPGHAGVVHGFTEDITNVNNEKFSAGDSTLKKSISTKKLPVTEMDTLTCRVQFLNDVDPFACTSLFPEPPRAPSYTFNIHLPLITQIASVHRLLNPPQRLDDSTLQIYRDGDYGPYLDLEASIHEQSEEFESFLANRKNSLVIRAQLPVRVNTIIEKLMTADGRELRRALFSLKQIFQEDKDLVHEFVDNGGLSCLIKVGSDADQNYQNYILRALGQVMLYVDGMYGVMRHNETIQWLYTLVASKFRLVQKTALKLLLVFVDYVETNSLLLVEAVSTVDTLRGTPLWTNVMYFLHESDSGDTELLVYAMTLVNKVLNGIPDIDTYYDQVDALEEQGMATLIQKYMGKECADLDLLQQLQIYEIVLKHEDGEGDIMFQLDESMRQKLMNRKGYIELDSGGGRKGRRKSRRHSSNSLNISPPTTPPGTGSPSATFSHPIVRRLSSTEDSRRDSDEWSSSDVSSTHSASPAPSVNGSVISTPLILNGFSENYPTDVGITPGLRRRREQSMEHQRSNSRDRLCSTDGFNLSPGHEFQSSKLPEREPPLIPLGRSPSLKRDVQHVINNSNSSSPEIKTRPWALPVYPNPTNKLNPDVKDSGIPKDDLGDKDLQLRRESTVKDLTQKLTNQNGPGPQTEEKCFSRTGDRSGIISKAKEGLAKSKSKIDLKPSPPSSTSDSSVIVDSTKKSDNELHWDFLVSNLSRSLHICDLDFTELKSEDDVDVISSHTISQLCNMSMNGTSPGGSFLPPPCPLPMGLGPPPPPPSGIKFPTPPKHPPAPPLFGFPLKHLTPASNSIDSPQSKVISKKTKKTVKLFWKEVREDPVTAIKVKDIGSIWDELQPIPLDIQKLEHLFESRAKDIINKKQQEVNKCKEVVVLDPKRSNAINIAMTKLPPPRTIKNAILKMDSTIVNREGIDKLLGMLPTDEERAKIQEAQFANPDIPLGNAEQFLLTLASISELSARLKLWAFKLDYENLEKEIAEPLMDLKLGIESLQTNKTFRCILTTLLCVGNFLNGAEAKGFQIDYLAKVPEVKDTVHKHSLLHHLCHMVIEKFPDSTDLYSEIGPVTRASRVDFDELATNLTKMESDCKASWDHLRLIAKHDGPTNMKLKMSEFLADCAERIIVLEIIHRRVMNRFHKFLLWLGVSVHQVPTTKPHYLFKVVSEFALEYRTTRDRVLQQVQKKANHRERNKTRGKMITDQILPRSKEDKANDDLWEVLNTSGGGVNEISTTGTWSRRLKTPPSKNNLAFSPNTYNNRLATMTLNRTNNLGDGDDEILESLVKTATQTPATRTAPRERKRSNTRYAERKSLRRTLRHGLTDEERQLLATFMVTGQNS